MFFKINKSKSHAYLQLVESYRIGKATRHKVIANLGRLEDLNANGQITKWGKRLLEIAGEDSTALSDIEELSRLCYGDIVYKKLWENYGFTNLLSLFIKGTKVKYDLCQTVYLLVIDRLLNPKSKLACYKKQSHYINIEDISLQHIYRCLDIMANNKSRVESHIFERQKHLFNIQVDVVFYDVTTYHFESIRPDELKDFGFSKTGKFNEVQVVMGLLIDMEGHPIGYELYPGNTFDGKTLVEALSTLKKRFQIRKLILVADKGLNSGENLHHIKSSGYDYIVSSRLKNASAMIKQKIFSEKGYVHINDQEGDDTFKYKIIDNHPVEWIDEQGQVHQLNDRLVVSWSLKRAGRDRKLRIRQIEKAEKMIEEKRQPQTKKGFQRYIETQGKEKVVGIDQEKIEADEKWDGYYGIQTSQTNMDATKVMEAYHQLWKIESSFRVLKSTMRTRPVFHWTPKRIKGHFVVCFLAFVLERSLESKLKSNNISVSPEIIKEAINSLEVSEVSLGDRQYYLKARHLPLAGKILRIFKIKQPKNFTPIESWKTPY